MMASKFSILPLTNSTARRFSLLIPGHTYTHTPTYNHISIHTHKNRRSTPTYNHISIRTHKNRRSEIHVYMYVYIPWCVQIWSWQGCRHLRREFSQTNSWGGEDPWRAGVSRSGRCRRAWGGREWATRSPQCPWEATWVATWTSRMLIFPASLVVVRAPSVSDTFFQNILYFTAKIYKFEFFFLKKKKQKVEGKKGKGRR